VDAPPIQPPDEETRHRFRPRAVALVALAALVAGLAPIPLPDAAHRTLVILVAAGGLWMTEALPVAVTALLIPLLGLTLGVADARAAFAGFGDPIVFLFFGTFLLTDAAQVHGLNDRLARGVLSSRWVSASPSRLLWAMALLGCGISAWVNNTATTAMLIPLALTARRLGSSRLLTSVLLMSSYSASLGGLATPVGTAPNLIGLRLLEAATGARPSFARWCAVFAPLAIASTALTAGWLAFRSRARGRMGPPTEAPLPAAPADVQGPLPPWSRAERTLMPVFVGVVLLWITPGVLAATPLAGAAWVKAWQARLPEPAVPLLGALLLFALPASARGPARILDVSAFRRVDWSTILLFGGGLSLGAMMFESGLAHALGEAIFRFMPVSGTFGIVLAATIMAVLVSEMTSNTASASLVVPVVLALAHAAGVDPVKPALAATVGCSFGFMLPVSTPPNALVYATGRVTMREMILNGALLDLIGVWMVAAWVTAVG
jgi:sodium-dependent dicarboxylate transporter 2/3/5